MTEEQNRQKAEGLEKLLAVIKRYAMEPMDHAIVITTYLAAWKAAAERETDDHDHSDAVPELR